MRDLVVAGLTLVALFLTAVGQVAPGTLAKGSRFTAKFLFPFPFMQKYWE